MLSLSRITGVALILSVRCWTPALAAEPSAELVRIPFNPPTGQDLSYTVITTRVTPGKTSKTESKQVLRFERAATGYILSVRTVRSKNDKIVLDLSTQ
jgi:hypothetical protein